MTVYFQIPSNTFSSYLATAAANANERHVKAMHVIGKRESRKPFALKNTAGNKTANPEVSIKQGGSVKIIKMHKSKRRNSK